MKNSTICSVVFCYLKDTKFLLGVVSFSAPMTRFPVAESKQNIFDAMTFKEFENEKQER